MGTLSRRRVTVTLEVDSSEALHELRRKERWNAALCDSTIAKTTTVLQAQANVIDPRRPKDIFRRRRPKRAAGR